MLDVMLHYSLARFKQNFTSAGFALEVILIRRGSTAPFVPFITSDSGNLEQQLKHDMWFATGEISTLRGSKRRDIISLGKCMCAGSRVDLI